jgi:hypothetical protein
MSEQFGSGPSIEKPIPEEGVSREPTDLEKLGENAASLVRGTFAAMNDFLEEFQNEEERERMRGRMQEFRDRYPQAVTVAAVAAGAITVGALVWYLRSGTQGQKFTKNLRKISRTVPRVVNRVVKRVA